MLCATTLTPSRTRTLGDPAPLLRRFRPTCRPMAAYGAFGRVPVRVRVPEAVAAVGPALELFSAFVSGEGVFDREVLAAIDFVPTPGCTGHRLPPAFGPRWQRVYPGLPPGTGNE